MKKFFVILATAAISMLCAIGVSVAYFTDTAESENNVVISGNIHIVQNEQERVKDANDQFTGKLQKYTQYQPLIPLVQNGSVSSESVRIGADNFALRSSNSKNYIDKIVTAKNVGLNPTYLRTFIAIPTGGYESSDPEDNWLRWDYNDIGWSWKNPDGSWNMIDDAVINGIEYDIYVATYQDKLSFGQTTPPSLLGFYLDSSVNLNGKSGSFLTRDGQRVALDVSSRLELLVATQASQTTTFDDPYSALDAVFGPLSADNHPWSSTGTHYVTSDAELDGLLNTDRFPSGTTVYLSAGTYTLPERLPTNVRLIGRDEVTVTVPATITGYYVTLQNMTILNDVSFRGNGEFDAVTFDGNFTAELDNYTYFIDCDFSAAPAYGFTDSAVRQEAFFENCEIPS